MATKKSVKSASIRKNVTKPVEKKSEAIGNRSESVDTQAAPKTSLAAVALIVSIVAVVIGGFIWYQNKESMLQNAELFAQLRNTQQQSSSKTENIRQVEALQQQHALLLEQKQQEIDSLQQQLGQLAEQMNKVQQQVQPQQHEIMRNYVQELIFQGQSLLNSNKNTSFVISVLNQAAEKISQTADPYWESLRVALDDDIRELESAGNENVVILYQQLEQIRKKVSQLVYQQRVTEKREQADVLQDVDGNEDIWKRAKGILSTATDELKKLVVIRKHDEGVITQLSTEAFEHVKLLVESYLSQAQTGLLQNNRDVFANSLQQARTAIRQRLSQYQLGGQIQSIDQLLKTDVFQIPDSLLSYDVVRNLGNE